MASTKQRQQQAKLQKQLAKLKAKSEAKMLAITPVKLYNTDDMLHQPEFGGTITQLPEGLQAYKTAIVNIALIPKGKMLPSNAWMTGYGCSYVTKVMSGTPRGDEQLLNAFLDGDENGDMLQIAYTKVGAVNPNEIFLTALKSLDAELQSKWSNRPIKTESGKAPMPLGWAKVTA